MYHFSTRPLVDLEEKKVSISELPNSLFFIVQPTNYKMEEGVPLIDPFYNVKVDFDLNIIPMARDKIFGNLIGIPIFLQKPTEYFVELPDPRDIPLPTTCHFKERIFYVLRTSRYNFQRKSKSIGYFRQSLSKRANNSGEIKEVKEVKEIKEKSQMFLHSIALKEKMYC
jgi:hypothetical protein